MSAPDPFDPREVLAAVQRLELELDAIRMRARRNEPSPADERHDELRRLLIEGRLQGTEDAGSVMDVVEAAWRAQRREGEALASDIAHLDRRIDGIEAGIATLRADVAQLLRALGTARVEVRFDTPSASSERPSPPASGTNGHPAPSAAKPSKRPAP